MISIALSLYRSIFPLLLPLQKCSEIIYTIPAEIVAGRYFFCSRHPAAPNAGCIVFSHLSAATITNEGLNHLLESPFLSNTHAIPRRWRKPGGHAFYGSLSIRNRPSCPVRRCCSRSPQMPDREREAVEDIPDDGLGGLHKFPPAVPTSIRLLLGRP